MDRVTTSAATEPRRPRRLSIARLHGLACVSCGAVHTTLFPAGTVKVTVRGRVREWPVVACATHRGTS